MVRLNNFSNMYMIRAYNNRMFSSLRKILELKGSICQG